jgi:lipopolysaccharide biosynthesis regulator YciM
MMVKSLLLALLYRIARQYFDKDLFDRIEKLVIQLMDQSMSGDTKREVVRKAIWAEWSDIKAITIDTVIQVVLLKEVS